MQKSNFIIAIIFHIIIVLVIVFFASREGMLGTKMKEISVVIISKQKIIEQPKPKIEQSKTDIPQVKQTVIEQPKINVPVNIPQPPQIVVPSVTPPSVDIPSFIFSDGAKDIISTSDPIEIYKSYIETYIRSKWNTPNKHLETIVDININNKGEILKAIPSNTLDEEWNNSIKTTLSKIKSFPKTPPKTFPLTFKVKFDTIEQ